MNGVLKIDKNYDGSSTDCACSIIDLDQLILQIKMAEYGFAEKLKNALYYKYDCGPKVETQLKKLHAYRYHLEDEQVNLSMGGSGCLDCNELQLMSEQLADIIASCSVDGPRSDLKVDKTFVDGWIIQNPYCVAREKWEYLSYAVLCNLQMDIEVEKQQACNITMDIIREDIKCDIVMALEVYRQVCDLNMTLDVTPQQCQIEFNLLIEDYDCTEGMSLHAEKLGNEITLQEYTALVKANISPSIIAAVYESGCCLSVEDEQVILNTKTGSFPLNNIKFTGKPEIEILADYGVDLTQSKYLQDPEAFVQKLNSDYRG